MDYSSLIPRDHDSYYKELERVKKELEPLQAKMPEVPGEVDLKLVAEKIRIRKEMLEKHKLWLPHVHARMEVTERVMGAVSELCGEEKETRPEIFLADRGGR